MLEGVSRTTRVAALRISLAIAWIAGLLISRTLWLSERSYPHLPVLPSPGPVPEPFDFIIFIAVLLLALSLLSVELKGFSVTFIVSIVLLYSLDQSRLQPWVYQYLLMTTAVIVYADEARQCAALGTCQFILASMYMFAGLHKINAYYINQVYPWFIEPIAAALPAQLSMLIGSAGVATPFAEMAVGVGLLTTRFRGMAIIGALLLHLLTIAALGPWGHNWNSTAWPWNVAMPVFVVIAFWRITGLSFRGFLPAAGLRYYRLVFVLCGIMPFFSFVHIWDPFLSVALYSGDMVAGTLYLEPDIQEVLPADVRSHINRSRNELQILDWSYADINVPPYPARRILKGVARSLCPYRTSDMGLILTIYEMPHRISGDRDVSKYSCNDLENR